MMTLMKWWGFSRAQEALVGPSMFLSQAQRIVETPRDRVESEQSLRRVLTSRVHEIEKQNR